MYSFLVNFVVGSECPVSVCEHREFSAVCGLCGDGEVFCTNHKVNVYDAVVYTQFADFFQSIFFVILYTGSVAFAESKVAGCVFVEKCIVEENAAVSDGGVIGNESTLAQITCTLVGVENGVEQVFAFFCMCFYDFSVF